MTRLRRKLWQKRKPWWISSRLVKTPWNIITCVFTEISPIYSSQKCHRPAESIHRQTPSWLRHPQPVRRRSSICSMHQSKKREAAILEGPLQRKPPTICYSWEILLLICSEVLQRQHQSQLHRQTRCGWVMVVEWVRERIECGIRQFNLQLDCVPGMNGNSGNSFVTDSSFSSVFGNQEPAGKNWIFIPSVFGAPPTFVSNSTAWIGLRGLLTLFFQH